MARLIDKLLGRDKTAAKQQGAAGVGQLVADRDRWAFVNDVGEGQP